MQTKNRGLVSITLHKFWFKGLESNGKRKRRVCVLFQPSGCSDMYTNELSQVLQLLRQGFSRNRYFSAGRQNPHRVCWLREIEIVGGFAFFNAYQVTLRNSCLLLGLVKQKQEGRSTERHSDVTVRKDTKITGVLLLGPQLWHKTLETKQKTSKCYMRQLRWINARS